MINHVGKAIQRLISMSIDDEVVLNWHQYTCSIISMHLILDHETTNVQTCASCYIDQLLN